MAFCQLNEVCSMLCLRTFEEFSHTKGEWEEFMSRCFPDNYSKTYPWLAAWWKTYRDKNQTCFYIKEDSDGKILSAAPLYICWEMFSGLPVRVVHLLGNGIGTDEFLISCNQQEFIEDVFVNIQQRKWDVARFNRIGDNHLLDALLNSATRNGCSYTLTDSDDFFIRLPKSINEYLQSRSKKFRRNLKNAENKLRKMGDVKFSVLDPYKDSELVQYAGQEIAKTSWQYKKNKSHFNSKNGETFYSNLTQFERGAGGEDFNLLSVNGKPVAYLLGCKREKTYFAIDTAYHADYKNISAGRILYFKIVDRLINEGQVDILDFEGSGEYKHDYANETKKTTCITIYNNSFYPVFLNKFRQSSFFKILNTIKNNSLN